MLSRVTLCGIAILAFALVGSAYATGTWPAIISDNSTGTGLPNPASGSDSGYGWSWSWSITGSNGSYEAAADATTGTFWSGLKDKTTGQHNADGYQKKVQPSWSSGPDNQCPCTHSEPSNAKCSVTYGCRVTSYVHGDSDNDDFSTGSCDGTAYASMTVSGAVAESKHCKLQASSVSWHEGAESVTGTFSADPSLEYNHELNGDTYDSGDQVNTLDSQVETNRPLSSGQALMVSGNVTIRASFFNCADESYAAASTSVLACSMTKTDGGTYVCDPPNGAAHGGH